MKEFEFEKKITLDFKRDWLFKKDLNLNVFECVKTVGLLELFILRMKKKRGLWLNNDMFVCQVDRRSIVLACFYVNLTQLKSLARKKPH